MAHMSGSVTDYRTREHNSLQHDLFGAGEAGCYVKHKHASALTEDRLRNVPKPADGTK